MKPEPLKLLPSVVREPGREYVIRALPKPKAFPPKITPPRRRSRHPSVNVTWLYKTLVQPHLPRYPTSKQFLTTTLPFLMRAVSPEVVLILSCIFADRHCSLFFKQRENHIKDCSAQIKRLTEPVHNELPDSALAIIKAIPARIRRNIQVASVICYSIANANWEFFMDCRGLKKRMLISQPRSALRILERMVRYKLIARVEAGDTHWDAKAKGRKARPNAYLWIAK